VSKRLVGFCRLTGWSKQFLGPETMRTEPRHFVMVDDETGEFLADPIGIARFATGPVAASGLAAFRPSAVTPMQPSSSS
jgi:hypothetical protein